MVEGHVSDAFEAELRSISKAYALKLDLRTKEKADVAETIVNEAPINIYINKNHVTTIIAIPDKLEELALGFLVNEGFIKSKKEINSLTVKGSDVEVETESQMEPRSQSTHVARMITTSCGSAEAFLKLIGEDITEKVESQIKVSPHTISQIVIELIRNSVIHQKTGGSHAAGIFLYEGKLVSFAEDVGRHNAVDKAVGGAILSDAPLSQCILASTGRQTADMVLKAVRAGIPVVISRAAPTYSGIYGAEKMGVTLVCFARGSRMNVYTHLQRIDLSSDLHASPS